MWITCECGEGKVHTCFTEQQCKQCAKRQSEKYGLVAGQNRLTISCVYDMDHPKDTGGGHRISRAVRSG